MDAGEITCQACEAEIAVTADVCPECGAPTDVVSVMRADDSADSDGESEPEPEDEGEAPTERSQRCPDCGARVSARAVRCPDCYAALSSEAGTAMAGADGAPSAGYRHLLLVPLLLAGAAGVTLTLTAPTGSLRGLVGPLNTLHIVGIPLVTLLDLRRVGAATDWQPRTELWVLAGVVPGVNVVSTALYLVRRGDATGSG